MATYMGQATLTAEQVAAYAYQAGFRGEALVQMVAIAARESQGYHADAHRTDSTRSLLSGDRGLWQINSVHDDDLLVNGIIHSKADLFDPAVNARAAFFLYQQEGLKPWGAKASGWAADGDPLYGTDVEAARQAVTRATQNGSINSDWARGAPSAPNSQNAPTSLPTDTKLVQNDNGLFAVYKLANGVNMVYSVPRDGTVDISGMPIARVDNKTFNKWYGKTVNGGNAAELANVRGTYGTYGKFWDSILDQVLEPDNPARHDAGVLRVLAEFAGRPDMSEAELQNKLKGTTYWQSKTESQLEWDSLSESERAARRQDAASRMAQTWFQYTGQQLTPGDQRIQSQVEAVASGKTSFSAWTETYLKPRALLNSESPWSRQVRTEQEEQRQRGVDVENTANQIRDTTRRYGLQWDEGTLLKWAKNITEKKASDKDLLDAVEKQAAVLYPWKPKNVDTQTAAAPWLQTYNRVMETTGDLFTPDVAKALRQGTDLWDFEVGLKKTPKWLETRNAREELFTLASEVGQRFGYT